MDDFELAALGVGFVVCRSDMEPLRCQDEGIVGLEAVGQRYDDMLQMTRGEVFAHLHTTFWGIRLMNSEPWRRRC